MGQILPPFSPVLIFFFFFCCVPACTLWQYWSVMKIYKKSVEESSFFLNFPTMDLPCLILFLYDQVAYLTQQPADSATRIQKNSQSHI